jgi:hypothetical protein
MPSFMEKKLKDEYKDLPDEERDNATYGTLNKIGFMRGNKTTDKGREAERQHEIDTRGTHDEPDSDPMADASRMGDDDGDERGGFMSNHPAEKKKRSFMRDKEA